MARNLTTRIPAIRMWTAKELDNGGRHADFEDTSVLDAAFNEVERRYELVQELQPTTEQGKSWKNYILQEYRDQLNLLSGVDVDESKVEKRHHEWEQSDTIGKCGYKWYVCYGVYILTHPDDNEIAFENIDDATAWAMMHPDSYVGEKPHGYFEPITEHLAYTHMDRSIKMYRFHKTT